MRATTEHHDDQSSPMSAVDLALHAARSALTVAGGRVTLAQRQLAHGAECAGAARHLAIVPDQLAQAQDAITRLADAVTDGNARTVIPDPMVRRLRDDAHRRRLRS
jgi:predicted DCC family thiol-disulfide oxidoreductase YuxK